MVELFIVVFSFITGIIGTLLIAGWKARGYVANLSYLLKREEERKQERADELKVRDDKIELLEKDVAEQKGIVATMREDQIRSQETTNHIKTDIGEMKETMKEITKGLNKLTTAVTVIADKMNCKITLDEE